MLPPRDPATSQRPMMDNPLHAPPRSSAKVWIALVVGVLALAAGVGAMLYTGRTAPGTARLAHELRDRGRLAVVGPDDLLAFEAEGVELVRAQDVEGLSAALDGTDEGAVDAALVAGGIAGLVVDGRDAGDVGEDAPIRARLAAYASMETLRGVYLAPGAALYERRRGLTLEPEVGATVARAARLLVGGASIPRIRAFPEPVRRSRNVEVMVMLERGGRPRLWRSARGGSIARALITAASVARQRWVEREQAMGGPIDERLPRMTVRVFLLEEDGTLGDRSAAFIERIFGEEHGVAFENRGSWHYLLPLATHERGEGSAMHAYEELFSDAGLPADSLGREELRPYRLVAREVGVSVPTSAPPPSPDDLLGPAAGLDTL